VIKKLSSIFEKCSIVQGKNIVTNTSSKSNPVLDKRTGDLGLLKQVAAEDVSAGCSCLNLLHETVTVTVTPSQEIY
jgi:hypothetical protein